MKEHAFTLILNSEPDDDQADRLYGLLSGGTIATIAGVPQIHVHRAGASLTDAIRTAIADVRKGAFDVIRVEIAPESLLRAS